ncbi:MAG: Efflux transporter, RND family, MFP subunit [Candidatus Woesebacteria bacterium GW2011_GWF1_40_24]|uniref:Efflux transporter, RND family, MFP subunit n=1 Tax=Candidatus Woesebacteria bacterium GW2011_GWF1_40_24 TaxID=1618601 RepID=A0A0G0UZ91_9BACT|nr:MAG: Efflux transporter, RND family, MFP subunit [Candidatus Woesebacteria bacterium GW2011_GWF1_40_24]
MKKILKRLSVAKKKMGKWFWVLAAVPLLAILAFILTRGNKPSGISVVVQKGPVVEELVLSGQVKAVRHAILYFPTSGKISWVGVKEGDKVNRGQGLVSLDKTILNSAYQQALNTYRNYQASAENVLDSVKDHSGDETYSQKAVRTSAEVARDNAYDAVTASLYNLRNATIAAPFSGVVTSLPNPNPGIKTSLRLRI